MRPPAQERCLILPGVALTLMVILSQCGYQFLGRQANPSPEVTRVAVPVLLNRTDFRGIEGIFTRELIKEIERRGVARVVSRKEADAVLEGSIVSATEEKSAYDPEGRRVVDYAVTVEVGLVLRRSGDGVVLWRLTNLMKKRHFDSRPEAFRLENGRWDAFARTAEEIAREAVDRWGGEW